MARDIDPFKIWTGKHRGNGTVHYPTAIRSNWFLKLYLESSNISWFRLITSFLIYIYTNFSDHITYRYQETIFYFYSDSFAIITMLHSLWTLIQKKLSSPKIIFIYHNDPVTGDDPNFWTLVRDSVVAKWDVEPCNLDRSEIKWAEPSVLDPAGLSTRPNPIPRPTAGRPIIYLFSLSYRAVQCSRESATPCRGY